jgi:hypothetical protein
VLFCKYRNRLKAANLSGPSLRRPSVLPQPIVASAY